MVELWNKTKSMDLIHEPEILQEIEFSHFTMEEKIACMEENARMQGVDRT